jgi:hypothetical protein
MDAETTKTAADLAIVTAATARAVAVHSWINHALLGFIGVLLAIVGWFAKTKLCEIQKGIGSKADKEENHEAHEDLYTARNDHIERIVAIETVHEVKGCSLPPRR